MAGLATAHPTRTSTGLPHHQADAIGHLQSNPLLARLAPGHFKTLRAPSIAVPTIPISTVRSTSCWQYIVTSHRVPSGRTTLRSLCRRRHASVRVPIPARRGAHQVRRGLAPVEVAMLTPRRRGSRHKTTPRARPRQLAGRIAGRRGAGWRAGRPPVDRRRTAILVWLGLTLDTRAVIDPRVPGGGRRWRASGNTPAPGWDRNRFRPSGPGSSLATSRPSVGNTWLPPGRVKALVAVGPDLPRPARLGVRIGSRTSGVRTALGPGRHPFLRFSQCMITLIIMHCENKVRMTASRATMAHIAR